jgi:cytochrome P450
MGTTALPPGPRGSWLYGNLDDFRRDRLAFLARCARDHGDVVRLRFGPRRVFLVSDPALIESVLVANSRLFIKHFALRLNSQVLGNGLLTSEGEFWLRQRRLAQPAFQRQRIAAYAPVMIEETRNLMASWTPGRTVDVLVEMMRLTLQIAARTLFGADVAAEAATVRQALTIFQETFIARFSRLLILPSWLPTPANVRLWRAVRRLNDILYRFIAERRQAAARGEMRDDLLSLLLRARDEDDGGQMTDRQLRDEAMTLFLAGHETTALTLAWTWYLLASNPHADERMQAELATVLGGREPTIDDWPKLRYTEHVILESMRLYPPAYVIGREALQDWEVGGFRVPRKTTLLMSQWVVQRDPRWFDEPDAFRPERWDDPKTQQLPKFAYFPFGGGPRVCIGNTFAVMETVLVLATLAQRWRFTLTPGHPVVPVPTFTLRPQKGILAPLMKRG